MSRAIIQHYTTQIKFTVQLKPGFGLPILDLTLAIENSLFIQSKKTKSFEKCSPGRDS